MPVRPTLTVFAVLIVAAACGAKTPPAPDAAAAPDKAAAPDTAAAQPPPSELQAGASLYEANCAKCHGPNAEGTSTGPPFIHALYVPSHHGDDAFVSAALNGVTAHHWKFGDMPPVEGMTEPDVRQIVPYIRWLQGQQGSQ